MAPKKNPPDLFNFLEKVFSCGPEDKKARIRAEIPEIQQERRNIALAALRVVQKNRRRGDKPGTFRNQEEFKALNALERMNNPPERESRPAPNLNREAPQSSIIFQALKVSEDFINLFTGKNQKNETPSSSPQTTGSGESFLSSIFCCSPRRK